MATDLTLRAAGLYTDPNPHSDAPVGALRVADNVVIRRAGVIEPRPGFRALGLGGGARYVGIHPAPTGDTSEFYSQTIASLEDDSGASVAMSGEHSSAIAQPGEYAGASAGRLYNRLYIPADQAVAVVRNGAARAAGVPRPGQPIVLTTSTNPPAWLLDTEAVAYRAVIVNDIGDRIIVGPPSGRYVYRNATGSTVYPTVRLDLGAAQVGWFVQLYRSLTAASGVEPGDELYLCAEQEITAFDTSQGYIEIRDVAATNDLGTSLYTNATQDGALQENGRPPESAVAEAYAEMMFYGRITEPHRLVLRFREFPNVSVPDPTTIGVTASSTTFTLVSGETPTVDNLGQFIVQDPTGTVRTSGDLETYTWFAGTSPLTLGIAALNTNALRSVTFCDWIALDDDRSSPWTDFDLGVFYPAGTRAYNISLGDIPSSSEDALSLAASYLENVSGNVRVVATEDALIFERTIGTEADDAIAVRLPPRFASLIEASPPAYTSVAATGPGGTYNLPPAIEYQSEAPQRLNRVFYSKKQQPEHVPPVNFIDIGADSEPIMAMRATRRALFVFKTDGIWTIQGDTPETLRVQQIDSTARLLHPKAVAVGGDRVFAWTDGGVLQLGEGGVEANLSAPAIEPDLRDIQVALQATSDPASGSTLGCFLAYQDGEERILLGVPATINDDEVASVYQYDMRTQGWTRWTWETYELSAATSIGGRVLFVGLDGNGDGEAWRETLASDEAPHSDVTYAVSFSGISTQNPVTVRVTSASPVPPVGSWIYQFTTATRGVVTDVNGTTVTINKLSGTLSANSGFTAYDPVQQCIEWVAKTAQAPTVTKHWQRGVIAFESYRRMHDSTLSFRSSLVYAPSSVLSSHVLQDEALPENAPFIVTRDHARAGVLLPKLCISQGGARWAISALHLDYELGSSRAGRRTR